MSRSILLDVHGQCRGLIASSLVASWADPVAAFEDPMLRRQPAVMLTDWGPGAIAGVATVQGPASTAAAVLEKQLRDRGETDDLSHLIVHRSQTRAGSTELLYTAVPMRTWQRYQRLSVEHPSLWLIHDWWRTLSDWCQRQELDHGLMLAMHPQGLDLLLMERGRVVSIERLRVFAGETEAWQRVGGRVSTTTRERAQVTAEALPVALWVLQGAEHHVPALLSGLAPLTVTEVWAEAPEQLTCADVIPPLPAVQRLQLDGPELALPLKRSLNRFLDKAAACADRWVRHVGWVGVSLSLVLGVAAAVMHTRTQQGYAELHAGDPSQALWQTLNQNVQQADRQADAQKDSRQWLKQRLVSAHLPDINQVLGHLRRALPPGLVIDEIGLAVEDDQHLLTVIGHALDVEDSLSGESQFAQALRADGFNLQKRDLLLRDGQPRFKLSMTWSSS